MSDNDNKMNELAKKITDRADQQYWMELTQCIDELKNKGAQISLPRLRVPLGKHWVHHQHGSDCMELDTTYLLDELKHQLNEATKAYRHENALARFFYTVERLEKEQRLELSNEPEE